MEETRNQSLGSCQYSLQTVAMKLLVRFVFLFLLIYFAKGLENKNNEDRRPQRNEMKRNGIFLAPEKSIAREEKEEDTVVTVDLSKKLVKRNVSRNLAGMTDRYDEVLFSLLAFRKNKSCLGVCSISVSVFQAELLYVLCHHNILYLLCK